MSEPYVTVVPGCGGEVEQDADEFVQSNPDEELALVTGDAASGTIRGIGVFDTPQAGGAANSRASFAAFMDQVEPMIAGPPERIELDLAHVYVRQ